MVSIIHGIKAEMGLMNSLQLTGSSDDAEFIMNWNDANLNFIEVDANVLFYIMGWKLIIYLILKISYC